MNKILKNFFYKFTRVLKNLPDAVLLVEKNGEISWVNERATVIFGYKKKDLKKYLFDEIVDNGKVNIEKSVATKSPIVAGAFGANSKEIFVELNAKQHFGRYIVTIRDITAITDVLTNAEQTNQFNKEKNVMLVKIANDIISPINSITGFSQALLDGMGGKINAKQSKYVKIINKSSNDLLHLMEKFIEFSYAESTLYEHTYSTFDIVNTINNVIKNYDEEINAKNLTVNVDCEELNDKAVYSDEKTLKTILQNIIETSINLTESGSITVKAFYPDEELIKDMKDFENVKENSLIQISISDTGVGMQENELSTLFEPYEQLDKQNKRNMTRAFAMGTVGILLKRINGVISVDSEVMKGTNFNIIVPMIKDFHE